MGVICFFVFYICYYLINEDMKSKVIKRYQDVKDKSQERASLSIRKKTAYEEMDSFLNSSGAKYRLGANFSPFDFTVMRLVCGCLLAILGLLLHPALFFVGAIIGYIFPAWSISNYDHEDNKRMLADIELLFSITALQLRNGVYISKVIYECYLSVENPRLKQALLDLSLSIDNKNNPYQAFHDFDCKFNNEYIHSYCVALEQLQDYGIAVHMLDNLQEQMKGIRKSNYIRIEETEENRGFLVVTVCFIGAIIFLVYCFSIGFSDVGSSLL